ncbi:type II secretion system F family protein [Nitrospina sp. 32_T5]|uniref:type II secretion system F family protein n=1 Tax=unclassified Nitrospina TaxID=2638683 RepID=UPI003F99C5A6
MPQFQYKARNRMGTLISGTMTAATQQDVGLELSRMGHYPVAIETARRERPSIMETDLFTRFQRIKTQEIVLFTRQMSTLFNAGIPILSILQALEDQVENQRFKAVVRKLQDDIADGLALSEAMARHPDVFPDIYINMIEAGETGGIMEDVLARLADLLEKQQETDAKVRAAFRYPKIVLGVMVIAIAFLMWKVVPVFINLFQTIKVELPMPTQILVLIHGMFVKHWISFVVVVVGGIYLFRRYTATQFGRHQWDYIKLQIPLLGPIHLRSSMAKFARVFGNLQRSGVPILESLHVSARVVDNTVLTGALMKLIDSVEEGKGLARPLRESGWVPILVVQMVAAGETSGALDEMLLKVADYYDQEGERSIKALSTWLEPILIVVMGVMVLFLALSIFLPMWDMSKMALR